MKRIILAAIAICTIFNLNADNDLWHRFVTPPDEYKTKLWWFHGEAETTDEGIRHDLKKFKEKGIGGVIFYDQVHGKAETAFPSMSPEWWRTLKYAAKTAKELGLSFEVAVGNGYVAGGPWITPDLAMKKTVFIDTVINNNRPKRIKIGQNLSDYHDIASILFEDYDNFSAIPLDIQPIKLMPGDTIVNIDLGEELDIRGISFSVTPRGKGSTSSMNIPGKPSKRYFADKYVEYPPIGELEISDDNMDWNKCCDLLPIDGAIGHKSKQRSISFLSARGRYVRLNLHEESIDDDSYKPITLSDLTLHCRDIIDNVEVKSGLRTEVAYPSVTGNNHGIIDSRKLINVTDSIDDDGNLNKRWQL